MLKVMNNILYIGLNGFAGAGKDTVAKMLKTILENDWKSLEDCKNFYFSKYTDPTQSATFNSYNDKSSVLCIAYADQLKIICSTIFGIPIERFYMNKSNAWICINDKFQYTEIKPNDNNIITAEDYYFNNFEDHNSKWWMSLREILVYIGTYVLQKSINKSVFVNIVSNLIQTEQRKNPNLKYVIVTDNRFSHELQFMKDHKAVTMSIIRDSIQQLDNVAEHDLDDEEDYDYIVNNSETYDALITKLWNIVHDNIIFENNTITLDTRENINNYLRLIDETEDEYIYMLCTEMPLQNIYYSYSEISVLNPTGGPVIKLNMPIENIDNVQIIPTKICKDDLNENYLIYCSK